MQDNQIIKTLKADIRELKGLSYDLKALRVFGYFSFNLIASIKDNGCYLNKNIREVRFKTLKSAIRFNKVASENGLKFKPIGNELIKEMYKKGLLTT